MTHFINKGKGIFKKDALYNLLPIKQSNLPDILPSLEDPSLFIAVKNVNWEKAGLVDSWENIAPYTHWDWGNDYDQYASDWSVKGKAQFNEELIDRIMDKRKKDGVNLFFSYLSGRWVYPETIKKIGKEGIFTVNLGFDDSQSFWSRKEAGYWSGNAEICRYYDLNLTLQSPRDVSKYSRVGARGEFLFPGGNDKAFYPVKAAKKDIAVSFIGQPYGERGRILDYLKRNRIEIQGFGKGWPSGMISRDEMLNIYSSSLITLGFGYVGNSSKKTGLKGRDFEIPLTGTAYLTTYNPELAKCFAEGEEILFYRNKQELKNIILRYLKSPERLLEIGRKGRERALKDHLWSDRWEKVLNIFFV